MLDLLSDPNIWASLAALTVLEIVLGIDNVIFVSVAAARLPEHQQARARYIGLALALGMRIILLAMIAWIVGLTAPVFSIGEFVVSWRDVILLAGGLFLLVKGTQEMHNAIEGDEEGDENAGKATATFGAVIAQIGLLDMVFSLDSVITAVGMVEHLPVMIAAVVIAMGVMLAATNVISTFIHDHPTAKVLALAFLLLVGVALVADGLHFHIPRGYIYFAIAFAMGVEAVNLMAAKRRKARRAKKANA